MEERKHFIYRHIRLDKNVPFYIGQGVHRKGANTDYIKYYRAFDNKTRNNIWKRITDKTKFRTEIILDNLSLEDVHKKEIYFIKLYGRIIYKNGTLANMSEGGEKTALGNKLTLEQIEKITSKTRGRKRSKEFCERLSRLNTGKKASPETRLKLSIVHKGLNSKEKHPMWNKHHSEESKLKISLSKIGKNTGDKHVNSKKVVDTLTGNIYSCLREASDTTGIKYKQLSAKLLAKDSKYNNTTFIYLEDYLPYKLEKA